MNHPVRFIAIALLWAFFFYGLNIILGLGAESVSGLALIILGGASPFLAAVYLVVRFGGKTQLIKFLSGLWDVKRIGFVYWAVAFLLPLAVLGISVFTAQIIFPDVSSFEQSRDFSGNYLAFVPFALIVLIMGPLPEEIGWRGYLLPSLGQSVNLLWASMIIAVVWGMWHVPLFFIDGYPLSEKLAEPLSLLPYYALLFPKSIVYTWLFFKTGRSILAAVVFHFSINFYGMIWDTTLNTQFIELGVWFIAAVWLIMLNLKLFRGNS